MQNLIFLATLAVGLPVAVTVVVGIVEVVAAAVDCAGAVAERDEAGRSCSPLLERSIPGSLAELDWLHNRTLL